MSVPLVVVLGVQAAFKVPSEWVDVFVRAARLLEAGGDIYFRSAYLYPPFMALVTIPFVPLPDLAARLGWFVINIGCIVGLVRSAWLLAGGSTLQSISRKTRRDWAVASAGILCSGPYILNALAHQQVDIIIGFLAIAGCLLLVRGRNVKGGVLIGLAAACKGPPLLFAAYLVFRRQWLAASLIIITAVGANLLPDLVVPPPGGQPRLMVWAERFVAPSLNGPLGSWNGLGNLANQSLAGTMQRMFAKLESPPSARGYATGVRQIWEKFVKASAYGLMLILLAASIVAAQRGQAFAGARTVAVSLPSHTALELSAVSLLMLLLSPMTDLAHMGPVILPAFCLARIAIFRRDRIIGAIVILAAAGALAMNKDLLGAKGYTSVLWAGVAAWSMLVLWVGCIIALVQGDGQQPASGFADSIFPFLARRSTAPAIAGGVDSR